MTLSGIGSRTRAGCWAASRATAPHASSVGRTPEMGVIFTPANLSHGVAEASELEVVDFEGAVAGDTGEQQGAHVRVGDTRGIASRGAARAPGLPSHLCHTSDRATRMQPAQER